MSGYEPTRGDSIHLTNQTARALRRCALGERNLCRAGSVALTLALVGVSVALGVLWLPAVPLVLLLAALLDALLLALGRRRYLTLTSQAICTEAAARSIREQGDEKRRRRQALSDLAGIREDMERMARERPDSEEDDDLLPENSAKKPPEPRREAQTGTGDTKRLEKQEPPRRRRRRQPTLQVIGGETKKDDAREWHHEARQ